MTDRIVYSLENGGETIVIENTVPRDFLKLEGRDGFGVAPTTLLRDKGSVAGSKHRRTRREERIINMPLMVFGANRDDVETKLRKLVRVLNDEETVAKLVATYPGGERWYTYVHYAGGVDPQYGPGLDTTGQEDCKVFLSLLAPDPYWTAEQPISYDLRAANQGRGLIKTAPLTKLKISSSQAIGTITVENPGDVAAYPVWKVIAPGDSFRAALGTRELFYEDAITAGFITISGITKKVRDQDDENMFSGMAPAPDFFPIPKGISVVEVEVPNATGDTVVSMYFYPRRELIF